MFTVQVKVDEMKRALDAFVSDTAAQTTRCIREAMASTEGFALNRVASQVKRRSGKLEKGFRSAMTGAYSGHVYNSATSKDGAPYPLFLDKGTKAHGPVRAKFLSWIDYDTGKRIFAKWVRGITPRPFIAPATEHGRTVLLTLLEHGVSAVARQVRG